jgi:hypothetical protein
MKSKITKIDVRKLDRQLPLVRITSLMASVSGDCRAVARLTCEAFRLEQAISVAGSVSL